MFYTMLNKSSPLVPILSQLNPLNPPPPLPAKLFTVKVLFNAIPSSLCNRPHNKNNKKNQVHLLHYSSLAFCKDKCLEMLKRLTIGHLFLNIYNFFFLDMSCESRCCYFSRLWVPGMLLQNTSMLSCSTGL
jgi:hypothetical protein